MRAKLAVFSAIFILGCSERPSPQTKPIRYPPDSGGSSVQFFKKGHLESALFEKSGQFLLEASDLGLALMFVDDSQGTTISVPLHNVLVSSRALSASYHSTESALGGVFSTDTTSSLSSGTVLVSSVKIGGEVEGLVFYAEAQNLSPESMELVVKGKGEVTLSCTDGAGSALPSTKWGEYSRCAILNSFIAE